MCGIAGIYHFHQDRSVDENLLQKMNHCLRHRGPDASAVMTEGTMGFSHCRLKIIDLSDAANQPFRGAKGTWLVYNGECYNYRELQRLLRARGRKLRTGSDTEVVLGLYEEFGLKFLSLIQGMFALAIWDNRQQEMILARDRIGIKPLYYSLEHGTLSFASELKALLALPWVSRDLDPQALGSYFRLYSILDPLTIFKNVRRLEPGHLLKAKNGRVHQEAWWTLPEAAEADMDLAAGAGALQGILQEAVASHLVADVPVGVALSSGTDSSVVACLAKKAEGAGNLHSFTLATPGSVHDEGAMAAEFAKKLGTIHHEVTFPEITPHLIENFVHHADEPFAISSGLGLSCLAAEARKHGVEVLLTGDGGDELFGGYLWRHAAEVPETGQAAAYARSVCYNGNGDLGKMLAPETLRWTGDSWLSILAAHYRRPASRGPLYRRLYTDVCSTLASEMLHKADRMTMAHGVEARVPLLDHRVLELAFALPGSLKIAAGQGKAVLRRAALGLLPPEITSRTKRGFNINLANKLAVCQREWTLDILAAADRRGFYAPGALEKWCISPFRKEEIFRLEDSHRLFSVLALELWFNHFLDGKGV